MYNKKWKIVFRQDFFTNTSKPILGLQSQKYLFKKHPMTECRCACWTYSWHLPIRMSIEQSCFLFQASWIGDACPFSKRKVLSLWVSRIIPRCYRNYVRLKVHICTRKPCCCIVSRACLVQTFLMTGNLDQQLLEEDMKKWSIIGLLSLKDRALNWYYSFPCLKCRNVYRSDLIRIVHWKAVERQIKEQTCSLC